MKLFKSLKLILVDSIFNFKCIVITLIKKKKKQWFFLLLVCTFLLILFIKSTEYCPAHFILTFFHHTHMYVHSLLVVLYIRPWSGPDLHFTAGYILYNCVCDK